MNAKYICEMQTYFTIKNRQSKCVWPARGRGGRGTVRMDAGLPQLLSEVDAASYNTCAHTFTYSLTHSDTHRRR